MDDIVKPTVSDNDLQRAMNRRIKIEAIVGVVFGVLGLLSTLMHVLTQ